MDWKDVAKVVSKAAPALATVLGGPAAGVGVSLLASVFGFDSEKTDPEEVLKIIQGDPEAILKMKELELNHKIEIQQLILQREKLQMADLANARQREVRVVEATGKKDYNLYILAWTVVVGFFVLCGILMKYPLPKGQNEVVFLLFGALATGFGTVLAYFFGSSKSSSEKTRMLIEK